MPSEPSQRQLLLTPGPTPVPDAVRVELAHPVIHHRTAQFRAIFADVCERLQRVFRTRHPVLTITGSGTTAFEAAQVSLIEPGQKAITCASGKFGERWQDVYDLHGVEQVRIDAPWGRPIEPQRVEAALRQHPDAGVVTVVHSETSTATASDLETIAKIVSKSAALLIVDGITSVGALPLEMDQWGVDAVVAGSQKALMLPPGLGFVALGPRALARLKHVRARGCYNLDLRRWLARYEKNDTPFTPAVNMIRALGVALEMIESEGIERVWERTALLAAATDAAFEALSLKLISAAPSDSVSGAFYPTTSAGPIDDGAFRSALRDKHGVHIAGGQSGRLGDFAGRVFRLSHMGHVDAQNTLAAFAAIETELIAAGHDAQPGTATSAAQRLLGAQASQRGWGRSAAGAAGVRDAASSD